MARIALGLLALTLTLGASGCTWTKTYQEYPPGLSADQGHHHHDDDHGQGHADE